MRKNILILIIAPLLAFASIATATYTVNQEASLTYVAGDEDMDPILG